MEVIGPTNEGEKNIACPPNLKQISLKSHASNIPKRIALLRAHLNKYFHSTIL